MLQTRGATFPGVFCQESYLEVEDAKPGACRRAGLDCETCVEQTARGMASLCSSLTEDQQKEAFRRVYHDACCQIMIPAFLDAYLNERKESVDPLLTLIPA